MLTLGTFIEKQSKIINLSNSSKNKNLQNAYNKKLCKGNSTLKQGPRSTAPH